MKHNYLLAYMAFLICLAGCGGKNNNPSPGTGPTPPPVTSKLLPISPVYQETPEWCWAATSQMLFTYYGLPDLNGAGDYQCGIVAAAFGPSSVCWSNCGACITGIGTISNMQQELYNYGIIANQLGITSPILNSTILFSYLTYDQVKTEILGKRPIVIGISPTGFSLPNISEHVALIVGFDESSGTPTLIVNDPFPFYLPQFGNVPDPYPYEGGTQIQSGQYSIAYANFVGPFQWGNTLYQIATN
jgi:hypothetical protein